MNALINIDRYLWKHFVPLVKPEYFSSKMISTLSILYISLFPSARKYFKHYLRGSGSTVAVETRKVILHNPAVYDTLNKLISRDKDLAEISGSEQMGQSLVSNPDDRYSLGSFDIQYRKEGEELFFRIRTNYNFDRENNRLTRHLHKWLNSMEASGQARSFNIEGDEWKVKRDEFSALKPGRKLRKYMDFNILYV